MLVGEKMNKHNYRNISGESNLWSDLMFRKTRTKQDHSSNEDGTNNANITAIAGSWIAAVGTIITAIGSTPSTIFTEQTLEDFNIIGNVLEAGGSAIALENEDALLVKVGGQLQVIGNIAEVAGILYKNEHTSQLLEKQGGLLQVVGLGITIQTQGKLTLVQTIANTGNIIQLIGNVIQVFADTDTREGEIMNAVGAWVQAVGAVITALATD